MSNLPQDFTFSQSSLQDYLDCPRRFQLKYIEHQRWPAPEVDDMMTFEQRMDQGATFHQLIHRHLLGIPPETLKKHIYDDDVRGWFETYLQNGLRDLPEDHHPERTLAVPLGDYALLAKFDLVALGANRAVIVDWKTGRTLPRRDTLAKRMQTIVYCYVLAKGGHVFNNGQMIAPEQIEMRYWYAEKEGQEIRFTYDTAQFQADEAYLLGLVQEIDERQDFPLTEDTQRCRFCTYRSLCDRGREAGSLADWELDADEEQALIDFQIDLDQIAEIAF